MKFFGRLRALFRKEELNEQLSDELRFHLEKQIEQNLAAGMSEEDARYAALRKFGGVEQVKEECRDAWGVRFIETLLKDIRYALRMLARNPGFAAVAVLTLALGIGANTAIFSIVNAVFLRPLPFPQADRIYVIDRVGNQVGGSTISFPIFLAWQKRHERFFDHLALLCWYGDATLSGAGESERVPVTGASSDLFSVLGVHPEIGRDFLPGDRRYDVVILSDGLWRSRFGADRNVLGKSITIDGEPHTIVGVLPRDFQLPIPGMRDAELWLPVQVPLTSDNAANGALLCVGLLKRDVTPAQAEAALTAPLSDLRREFPKMFSSSERAHLLPLRTFLAHRAGPAPWLLFGAVGLVLFIACANVANLTLARSTRRRREIAIRAAMGAGRSRVVRQLLTESVLLALLGGTLGVMVCYASFNLILALVPVSLPHVGAFQMDWTVLLFALFLSVFTGVVFGFAPALTVSRADLGGALGESNPRVGSGGRGRLRSVLAASEVGISLVLLIGAALALESFGLLMRVRPGFDPKNLLTFNISVRPKDKGGIETRLTFYNRAMARLRSMPDVEQLALIDALPLQSGRDVLFTIEGGSGQTPPEAVLDADLRAVSPEFFPTMRIPFLRGRGFSASDNVGAQPVVIINQTMARMFWPDQDPIGRRLWIGKPMGPEWTEPSPREIVGVVGDIHGESLASAPDPTMYLPYAQRPIVEAYFVIRTRQSPSPAVPRIRQAMSEVDPDLPLAEVKTMDDVLANSVTDWRFRTILLALFGGLALFIAAIGIYGVISYSVAQRTQEFGVRMALGAQRTDVLKMVVGQGLKLTLTGVGAGIVGALVLTRFMSSLLYGVKATDPVTFIAVSLVLTVVALLAVFLPARRATKVDPMVALRYE
jgi:putative ABC transport system permease protein